MNAVTPLPTQQDVRELVEGLLGRHVDAFGAHEGVKLERNRENLVGTYVTDDGHVNALVLVDALPLDDFVDEFFHPQTQAVLQQLVARLKSKSEK